MKRQILSLAAIAFLSGVVPAAAVTMTVTNTNNEGAGSLRQAIVDANSGDEITFNLSSGNETIVLLSQVTINKSLTIDGSNSAGSGTPITLQVTTPGNGGSTYRLFYINATSSSVVFQNLSLKGGDIDDFSSPDDKGGVIYHVAGDLTLKQVTITQAHATQGGGIYTDSTGSLVLEECTIDSCGAVQGGAIYADTLDIHIVRSTLSSNQASLYGGALLNSASGGVTHIVNSTIANNTNVYNSGGGIKLNSGTIYAVNSTITGNSSHNEGGGIQASASTYLYLLNSMVVGNTGSSGQDIHYSGTAEARYSWYDDVNTTLPSTQCSISIYYSTYLEALGDYGGPTQTVKVNTHAPAFTTGGTLAYYNTTNGYYYYDSSNDIYIAMPGGATITPSDPSSDVITIDQRGETRCGQQTMGAYHLGIPAAELHGPASQFKDSIATFTLASKLPSGTLAAVTQNTVFNLTSNSSGTHAFYGDTAFTTPITQITIPNGSSSATFYYRDDTYGDATITATRVSGEAIGNASATVGLRGNNAVLLDGTDDYIAAAGVNAALANPTALTVEGWIYPRATGVDMYYFCFNDDDQNERILVGLVGDRVPRLLTGGVVKNGATLSADQWHHLAITIAADNSAVVYVDGVSTITATVTARPQTDASFAIGQATNLSGGNKYFNGLIDDVRIWNVARSEAEIRKNMHRPLAGNESGLVAYYKFDNGTGTTAYDSAGSVNGTLENGVAWRTSGAFAGPRNALSFSGSAEGVLVHNFPKSSSVVCVEAWVYCENHYAPWGTIAKNWTVSTTGQFQLGLQGTSGKLGCNITQSDGTTVSIAEGVFIPRLPQNEWVHVAVVADGSRLRLYRNGIETASSVSYDGTLKTSFAPLGIGVRPNANGSGFAASDPGYWEGLIDEVRIWNIARTPTELRDNMCRTLNGDEAGLAAYYRFDQQSAAGQYYLYDQTIRGNNGTLVNMEPATDWIASTAFATWVGSIDNEWWTEAANWSRPLGGSPWTSGKDHVGIPSYPSSIAYPEAIVPTITASPNTGLFAFATDASITNSADSLTIAGNCFLNEDINLGTHDVTVNGQLITTGALNAGSSRLTVEGDFDATNGALSSDNSSQIYFKGDCAFGTSFTHSGLVRFCGSSNQTITGSPTFNAVLVQNTVNAAACSSLKINDSLSLLSGTFTAAGDWAHVTIGASGTLSLSGDVSVSADWSNSGTFTANNHAVRLDGTNQTLSGSTTFHTLIKHASSSCTLKFPASETAVTHKLDLQCSTGMLTLCGPSPSTTWTLTPPSPATSTDLTLKYLKVQDGKISNGDSVDVTDGTSVDGGSNEGWIFAKYALATLSADSVTSTSAVIRCNITTAGNPSAIQHGVSYVASSPGDLRKDERTEEGASSGTGEYTSTMTNLTPSTTYTVRAYAHTGWDTVFGDSITFTTLAPGADGAPDLRVTIEPSSDHHPVDEQIDFRIGVKNQGTAKASNVVLRFPLPANTQFIGAWLDQDTSTGLAIISAAVQGDEIVVNVGDVEASEDLKIKLALKAKASGAVTLNAEASCQEMPSAPKTARASTNVDVGDVYWQVVQTVAPIRACGVMGSALPLLLTLGLLAMFRRGGAR